MKARDRLILHTIASVILICLPIKLEGVPLLFYVSLMIVNGFIAGQQASIYQNESPDKYK